MSFDWSVVFEVSFKQSVVTSSLLMGSIVYANCSDNDSDLSIKFLKVKLRGKDMDYYIGYLIFFISFFKYTD